jgi:hypothetical protein
MAFFRAEPFFPSFQTQFLGAFNGALPGPEVPNFDES